MQLNRALKFRIYPNALQKHQIDATIDSCRFVYNKMLERNIKAYQRRGEHLSYNEMQNLLPKMKAYYPWLKEADSQALKYSCRQLDAAYARFFKKLGGFPNFKSKRESVQSYTATNVKGILFLSGCVQLPKLGKVKHREKRGLCGQICSATVSRASQGKYYVSIAYKYEAEVLPIAADPAKVIGLDYKSDGLYVDSDGNCCDMPHFYRENAEKLAKAQRKLRHMQRKSNNYYRQQKRIAKIQAHTANQRKDFLHKQSTAIAKRCDAVCIEDLDMRTMSNKGFGNGKATLDNGYGMFVLQLSYKLEERGKKLIKVDKWYPSSQICSCCGHRQKMPLSVRAYVCPDCGTVIDRDCNAAKNIRAEGLRFMGI